MVVTMTMALSSAPSRAQPTDAKGVVKAMSDFIAKQKTISITFDSDIEVITPELQKIQFTNSGTVLMSRPDKLKATRTGGYSHVELVFDGKTATILNTDANVYTRLDAAGSIDQLIERLRADHAVTAPGADLLLANVYDDLMEDVFDAKYIGIGVIDGVECAHLAFRTPEVDWQIWIEIWRPSDPAQICDHQQDSDWCTPVHASHQGMEDGRASQRGQFHVHATARDEAGRRKSFPESR